MSHVVVSFQDIRLKLYTKLRVYRSKNWPKEIQSTVYNLNHLPRNKGRVPASFHSHMDDTKLPDKVKEETFSFAELEKVQNQPPKPGEFKIDDYVYELLPKKRLTKSSDYPVSQLTQISQVFKKPNAKTLYSLKDLKGNPIKGKFYKEDLYLSTKPRNNEYFNVSKILGRKKVGNKILVKVSYEGYSPSFNEWIPQADLLIPENERQEMIERFPIKK